MGESVEFRLIPGFGDAYRIGSDGSFWSRRRRGGLGEWKLVQGTRDGDGYRCVWLRGGAKRCHKIHRLVLECFVGPCPDGMWARHLNGKPADNRLSNLKWDTPSNNARDRIKHGTQYTPWKGERNHKGKLTKQKVLEIRGKCAAGQSQYSLAKEYGVCSSTIHGIIHRTYWSHI